MSRIKEAFANKAKIAYLTAGDGGITQSIEYFVALTKGGVNLLEIGIPYSDPVADGPVIQQAMERALASGTTVSDVLDIVRQVRAQTTAAIILFSYYNPLQENLAEFLTSAKLAGADGVLIVDLPYEEATEYRRLCKILGLAPIMVIAPSTSFNRMKLILAGLEDGFIYYACQKGTTGTRDGLPSDLASQLALIKKASKLPIAVGFGIANAQMVNEILKLADGCVVGSYLVRKIEDGVKAHQLSKVTEELFHVA